MFEDSVNDYLISILTTAVPSTETTFYIVAEKLVTIWA